MPTVDFLTFIDKYSTFATLFVSLITIENGIVGYLYNNGKENREDDMETIDGIFFLIFVFIWIIGQIVFTIIGVKTKNFELKKLTMGTLELAEAMNQDDGASNYYFSHKFIEKQELDKLNHLEWVSLYGKKKV